MTPTIIAIGLSVPLGLLAIYAAVRVGAAAFFKSKRQFDNPPRKEDDHGTT